MRLVEPWWLATITPYLVGLISEVSKRASPVGFGANGPLPNVFRHLALLIHLEVKVYAESNHYM